MKKLLELGNRFAKQSDWKDFALTKFCLCAMGILIGICIPDKNKKCIGPVATIIFASSYLTLMSKVLNVGIEMLDERRKVS